MKTGRLILLATILSFVQVALASCTYNVTGPEDSETLTSVAIDPNLSVGGLEVFKQEIHTETDACSMASVLLDYRDEAMRRTQLAWQVFREKSGASTGSLQFDSLEVTMQCTIQQTGYLGVYPTFADPLCTTRMILDATFIQESLPPVSKSAVVSNWASAFDCSGTKQSVEDTMPQVLDAILFHVFRDYGSP